MKHPCSEDGYPEMAGSRKPRVRRIPAAADGAFGSGRPAGLSACAFRWVLLVFGWLNVVLGVVGVAVPGLPTTVFLIVALWAFSRSSGRFRLWLWEHPQLGPPVHAWHRHRVIPLPAKIAAAAMMTGSFAFLSVFIAESWILPALLAVVMAPAGLYVCTRAGSIPDH